MESQYNTRSPAVKRLMREAEELRQPMHEFFAQPLDDNLFEWHFTVRGPPDSDFDGGCYHGRIILPTEYPMKPPSIIMLTPNGRFEVNKKICLSISGYHPESWQPSWSIRTALLAIIGFMPTEGLGAIGSLDYPSEERKSLAFKSQSWCCASCGRIKDLLKEKSSEDETEENKEAKELAKQICFKNESVETDANVSSSKNNLPKDDHNLSESSPSATAEVRRRITSQETAPQSANQVVVENNGNLRSSTRLSTYLIICVLSLFCLLLFRRAFLV